MPQAPAGEPQPPALPCMPCECGPAFRFQVDWLWRTHAGMWSNPRSFIDGPDAAGFDTLPESYGDNGYRFLGAIRTQNWIFEAVYSHYGDWTLTFNQNVNGVAFNAAAMAGNWAGENSINANTYFTPIASVASQTAPVNTAGDQSGFGPSTAFPTDARPALIAYEHNDFHMTEANMKGAAYLVPFGDGGMRCGIGYVNANLESDAFVDLTGTFRATNGTAATVSLPNSVLTSPAGGGLTLYGGGGGGFTDGVSNGGAGTPSQLRFTHHATVQNALNGAQFLLDFDLLQRNRFDLSMGLKAGIFDNFAQGSIVESYSTTNNDLSAYYREFSGSCHHLAFLGGIGFDAAFHLTDEFSVCGGYDVLFLSNQALGQDQINGLANNWYRVQTDGSAVIQAFHLGLEIGF